MNSIDRRSTNSLKELPLRKQVVTQDRSKVLRETEENPFENDDGDEISNPSSPSHSRQASGQSTQPQSSRSSTPLSILQSQSLGTATKKTKKDKKGSKTKSKAFNMEAEKETMKNCIAESNIASTNLLNALRLINREQEQISENKAAVHHFEFCKLLRRKILRYVSEIYHIPTESLLTFCRFNMWKQRNG
jgi:hypothetical protein